MSRKSEKRLWVIAVVLVLLCLVPRFPSGLTVGDLIGAVFIYFAMRRILELKKMD